MLNIKLKLKKKAIHHIRQILTGISSLVDVQQAIIRKQFSSTKDENRVLSRLSLSPQLKILQK